MILSSGDVGTANGPNTFDDTTTDHGLPGDADLDGLNAGFPTFDASVLEFDFTCENADVDIVSFRYVFTSEEYNEWSNTEFNDVFGFFLNGTNIALLPDNVTVVSINNVNGGNPFGVDAVNPAFFINNDLNDGGPFVDIEADGLTVVLTALAPINPFPAVNHFKLAIADAGDPLLDSWVFLEAGSLNCGTPPPPVESCDLFVTFDTLPETLNFDGTAVPGGPAGTYSFDARLTNTGSDNVSDLSSPIVTLTGGNTVLGFPESPATAGDSVTIPQIGSYADGVLSPGESVDIPWVIGLAARARFDFFVGVDCRVEPLLNHVNEG